MKLRREENHRSVLLTQWRTINWWYINEEEIPSFVDDIESIDVAQGLSYNLFHAVDGCLAGEKEVNVAPRE